MTEIRPATADELKQSTVWEHGDLGQVDWEGWLAQMQSGRWLHLAILFDRRFVGIVSIEKFDSTARFHVSTRRRSLHPDYLVFLLRQIADVLFRNGVDRIEAEPEGRRNAARLAIRCGMKRVPARDLYSLWRPRYAMSRAEYYEETKTRSYPDALSAKSS